MRRTPLTAAIAAIFLTLQAGEAPLKKDPVALVNTITDHLGQLVESDGIVPRSVFGVFAGLRVLLLLVGGHGEFRDRVAVGRDLEDWVTACMAWYLRLRELPETHNYSGLRIHVHSYFGRGVPQQFPHDFYVFFIGGEKTGEGAAEGPPPTLLLQSGSRRQAGSIRRPRSSKS